MKINWKNVFSFGGGVVAHELAEQVLQKIFQTAGEQGSELLKGSFLGLGTNDEALFRSAVSYAVIILRANPAEIHRVVRVIGTLPHAHRSRVIQIIGKDEKDVEVETPVMDSGTGLQKEDKKGNKIFRKEKISMNVRGGQALAYFSELNDDQILAEFEASNMTSKLAKNMEDLKSSSKEVFDDLGNGLNSGNTALDRWANKYRK